MPEQKNRSRPALSFDRRLAAYAAGAGAVFAAAEGADATVIYSGPEDVTIGPGQEYQSYPLDMNGDGVTDFTFAETNSSTTSSLTVTPSKDIDPPVFASFNAAATSTTPGQPFPAGVDIASQTFNDDNSADTLAAIDTTQDPAGSGPFYGVSDEYLAVQFETFGALDLPTGYDYGWIELSVAAGADPSEGPDATIEGWAYNNDGTTLKTGQVPEPTPLALLALGAPGVLLLRPRRLTAAVQ